MKINRNIIFRNLIYRFRKLLYNGGNMYSFRMDDSVTSKAIGSIDSSNRKTKSLEDLVDSINKINHSLVQGGESSVDVEKPDFKRKQEIAIDEAAIKNQAETELKTYKDENIDKINKDSQAKLDELNNKKNVLQSNYDSTISNLDTYYDKARETVSNDALSRGLARSSIVINEIGAFTSEQLATYSRLNSELSDNINALDFEISTLETEKNKALESFDIDYAEKLNSKIAALREDLENKQNKIIEYNNEIEEKEAKFNLDYKKLEEELKEADWSKQTDIMEITGKYGSNVLERYKTNQVITLLDDYFAGKSLSVINYELKYNASLREALGKYYDSVVSHYE